MRRPLRAANLVTLGSLLVFVAGCAQGAYRYGEFAPGAGRSEKVVVERGEPHPTLDRLSDVVSWPRRKLFPELPDRREITPETLEQVAEYLNKNGLQNVHVSVRDYQPREQWRRLHKSRVVSPLAKYTVGSLSVVRYSLLPGRVFGRNTYNPYTDTLYVNSDAPALLIHEAAFAKNVREQRLPGLYAVASHMPFAAAWSELEGAQEVIGYAQAERDWNLEEQSYREVYPKVGAESFGGAAALAPVWWGGPLLSLAGGMVGGAAGRVALSSRESKIDATTADLVEQEVTGRAPFESTVQQAAFGQSEGESRRRYVTPSEHLEPEP